KLRLLSYLSGRLGLIMDAVITGVAEYGFFAQGKEFPAEGLVHVSSLGDDYYQFDADGHSLEGRRQGHRYRLRGPGRGGSGAGGPAAAEAGFPRGRYGTTAEARPPPLTITSFSSACQRSRRSRSSAPARIFPSRARPRG